jgi:hypothetical protein
MKSLFELKHFARAMCLLALSGAAAHANADDQYHVVLDMSQLTGSGWIDLQFNPGQDGAAAAYANVTNFSGHLTAGQSPVWSGAVVGDLSNKLSFTNSTAYNDLFQSVDFGQIVSFDLRFGGAFLTTLGNVGSSFGLGLYGADQISLLGSGDAASGSLLTFELMPSSGTGQFGKVNSMVFDSAMVSVSAIPEPSEFLLFMAGLAVLAAANQRRRMPG